MIEPSAERLQELFGQEHDLEEISRELKDFVAGLRAPVVGAMHVTCSDESERECADAFQNGFIEYLLPNLKFGQQSAFRGASLGARYEWGAVPIAELHYSTRQAREDFKVMVVKINAHVSLERKEGTVRLGRMRRYQDESPYCGALCALVDGSSMPFAHDLRELFGSEEKDRLALLRDPQQVDPETRMLAAAVVSARLQARRAMLDIQDHTPDSPTLYYVFPCVTLNRRERDTEILCGLYEADRRRATPEFDYIGLGDDPAKYRIELHQAQVLVEDDQLHSPRPARDHRELVRREWEKKGPRLVERPAEVDALLSKTSRTRVSDPSVARSVAATLLRTAAQLNPVASAVLLFAEGAAGIHHAFRAHRLARARAGDEEAHAILGEIQEQLDTLSPEKARLVIEALLELYR